MKPKNILVIGASSGIGYDLAVKLLKQQHNVYCGARRLDRLKPLEELGAKVFKVDVTKASSIQNIVNAMIVEVGSIDIVYSNAGYPIAGPVESESICNIQKQFDVNVYGAARVTQAVLPHMRARKQGRIVFTTSIAARASSSMNAWYSASKHALSGMAKALQQEVHDFNIKISTVEPGCVQTELPDIQLGDMLSSNRVAAYEATIKKSHTFLKTAYDKGSDTTSTVNTLIKAGFASNPKLVYQSTTDAKLMALTIRLFGEGVFGNLVTKIIAKAA
ncbi:SDR family NAD(P)-dependent oxidoreductase [Vibrio ishigakensis]|uniref:SDR family NAD(P)-dependent oxidoreductase n=1 Tax=Vibrio ishigakensis TaxID=1481914 RepID=UPI0021C4B486|nr:SDR family NAD(P)-dependent oxidoreductase [Vibrio ishigakensis]